MIGEIPISDACHYMDAHDTETCCCRRHCAVLPPPLGQISGSAAKTAFLAAAFAV